MLQRISKAQHTHLCPFLPTKHRRSAFSVGPFREICDLGFLSAPNHEQPGCFHSLPEVSLVVTISFLTRHSYMTSSSNLQFLIELTIASNSDFHQDWIHTHTHTSQSGLKTLSMTSTMHSESAARAESVCHRFSSGIGACTSPCPESSQSTVTTNLYLHFPYSCILISFTGHNTQ